MEMGLENMVLEFTASEDNYYDVQFRNGPLMSGIYGAEWEEFVREYGLHSSDRVVVGLEFYGLHLHVDVYRGEELLLPLPWLGKLVL